MSVDCNTLADTHFRGELCDLRYRCEHSQTVKTTKFNTRYAGTDQRSIKRQVARDVKLLAQDLMLNRVDTDALGMTSGQQVLAVCSVAQSTKRPAGFKTTLHRTSVK